MPYMIRQADGQYALDPDHHPADLVTVRDVYGHRHRVRQAHLDEARKPYRADGYGRTFLPLLNQFGRRLVDRRPGRALLHRDNLAVPPERELDPAEVGHAQFEADNLY